MSGKSANAVAICSASAVNRRTRMGIFGAVPGVGGVGTSAAGAAFAGTSTGAPQLLHRALRPANSSGTVNDRPQPAQVNVIIYWYFGIGTRVFKPPRPII